ncbi:DMT family transporter [Psittacicella hinzii]|uniref:Guanidinium exporter n=1 Tax=Psittacicella hinzii TaxID=2028575 RepID=A0A3A1YRC7_9GAMM|nr:multidrug efflux SMR transporter [Psittacicella hinzii]RIY40823.1 hypothetical protein CKF58_00045 [Psittacicella hinzii]
MAWIFLTLAGIMEIGWPIGFKLAQSPEYRILGIVLASICIGFSAWFLFMAQKTIPMGTAYAVWTGIGAAGAFVVGVLFFNETSTFLRWLGCALIILGVITLRLSNN